MFARGLDIKTYSITLVNKPQKIVRSFLSQRGRGHRHGGGGEEIEREREREMSMAPSMDRTEDTELRRCVKVEVVVLGSRSLISLVVSVT